MAVTTIGQLIESIRLLFPEGRVPKNLKTAGFCGSQRLKLKRLTLLDDRPPSKPLVGILGDVDGRIVPVAPPPVLNRAVTGSPSFGC